MSVHLSSNERNLVHVCLQKMDKTLKINIDLSLVDLKIAKSHHFFSAEIWADT